MPVQDYILLVYYRFSTIWDQLTLTLLK